MKGRHIVDREKNKGRMSDDSKARSGVLQDLMDEMGRSEIAPIVIRISMSKKKNEDDEDEEK